MRRPASGKYKCDAYYVGDAGHGTGRNLTSVHAACANWLKEKGLDSASFNRMTAEALERYNAAKAQKVEKPKRVKLTPEERLIRKRENNRKTYWKTKALKEQGVVIDRTPAETCKDCSKAIQVPRWPIVRCAPCQALYRKSRRPKK